jgi:multicomponent Na+:H+ antiporter subunit B
MANRLVAIIIIVGLALILLPLALGVAFHDETPALANQYIESSESDLATANAVTAVVVTYRGLDTLGEVTVLFAATAGVGFVVSRRKNSMQYSVREGETADRHGGIDDPVAAQKIGQGPSEILQTAARFLAPILLVFGVYIFVHGHLTPGGGFQGGVVIASATVLGLFGEPDRRLRHGVMTVLESISGAGYVVIGILGIVLVAGFLDPRFLPTGSLGALLSAGAIPIIYSLVGIKVGTELAGIVDRLRGQEEH